MIPGGIGPLLRACRRRWRRLILGVASIPRSPNEGRMRRIGWKQWKVMLNVKLDVPASAVQGSPPTRPVLSIHNVDRQSKLNCIRKAKPAQYEICVRSLHLRGVLRYTLANACKSSILIFREMVSRMAICRQTEASHKFVSQNLFILLHVDWKEPS